MTPKEAIEQVLGDQHRRLCFEQFNVEITNEIMIPVERTVDRAGADINQVWWAMTRSRDGFNNEPWLRHD